MNNPRIVIVGFMACGKTTVAGGLARRLGCEWIDLDSYITSRVHRSPAEIIEQAGERQFREIETKALQEVLKDGNARVIALGGGAWTVETNREMVAENGCLTVWLDIPFETCWERITSSGTRRPLAPDRATARLLFESRRSGYRLTDLHIEAGEDPIDRLMSELGKPLSPSR
jgi:shikimate kinase